MDFLVPSATLIIEVDGPYHRRRGQADARRERALRRLGYTLLRLEEEVVVERLPEALARIREAIRGGLPVRLRGCNCIMAEVTKSRDLFVLPRYWSLGSPRRRQSVSGT